jgi:hypothetical protein
MAVGGAARPLLEPLVLRTTPLPTRARVALLSGLVVAGAGVSLGIRRRRHDAAI